MQFHTFLVLPIGAALTLSIACGGSSDEDLTNKDITLAELAPLYAKSLCDAQRSCVGDLLSILLPGESCETNAETSIRDELPRIEQAIAAGKVRYDGTRFRACLDKIATQGCSNGPEPAECTAAIDGTVPTGGDCSMSVECAGASTYCKTDASCPGKCAPREAAGGPCNRDSECAANLRCSEQTERCYAPAAAGDACRAGAPDCRADLFCVGADDDAGRQGQCQTLDDAFSVAAGGSCLMSAPFCEPNLRCVVENFNPATGMGTTRCTQPVASGAPCQLAYPDVCPGDQYCAVAGSLNGRCTAKPGNGQPCAIRTQDEDPICAPNTRCNGGTCRQLQKLGGSCQTDDVCYSDNCIASGCAPAGACE